MTNGWLRLYVTVEGSTEKSFLDETLKKHLADKQVDVRPRIVITNRKLGGRGGINSFESIRGDLTRLMKEDAGEDARFTTMLDLYGLPSTFPGWSDASSLPSAERVIALEDAMDRNIADPRFFPFLMRHEFETLLYCDLSQLERRIEGSKPGLDGWHPNSVVT